MDLYSSYLTMLAVSDIDETLAYISNQLSNKKAASDLYKLLKETLNNACSFPYMYEDCSEYMIDNEQIRRAVVGNYVLVYEVDDVDKRIVVLRFLHQSRNIHNYVKS